jgi:hypothetical protein
VEIQEKKGKYEENQKETITTKWIAIDSIGVHKMIGEEFNWYGEELLSNNHYKLI